MIPLSIPNLSGNERKYLNECIDTTFVSSVGAFVTRMEAMVSRATSALYATATASGTTGLHTALMACGVKRDEIVIIPSYTFIATANAVSHCGAEPWCMDVDKDTWTLSPLLLEEQLKKHTKIVNEHTIHIATGKRVAAIMPVYTLGTPADIDEINRIAALYHLPVVADAAAALGARYKGKDIGDLADATVFSFNGNKTVTCGGGGMIVSNKKDIIDLAKHISATARRGVEYDFDMVGYNYRMTNIQAAVGCAQLERLDEFVARKRMISKLYNEAFSGLKNAKLFSVPDWAESACWFSGIILNSGFEKDVHTVCRELGELEIEGRVFWKPVHLQKPYKSCIKSDMRISENIWNRVLTLPCSTGIRDNEIYQVINAIERIVG